MTKLHVRLCKPNISAKFCFWPKKTPDGAPTYGWRLEMFFVEKWLQTSAIGESARTVCGCVSLKKEMEKKKHTLVVVDSNHNV